MPVGIEIGPDFKLQVQHFEPYVESREIVNGRLKTKFVVNDAIQIVSAGADRKYGHGGVWPLIDFPHQNEDRDNIANFASRRLGVGE